MVVPNESAIPWRFDDDTTLSPGLSDIDVHASAADTVLGALQIGWNSEQTRMTMGRILVSTRCVVGSVCTHSETERSFLFRWPNHPVPSHAGRPDVQGFAPAESTANPYCKTLLLTYRACPSDDGGY